MIYLAFAAIVALALVTVAALHLIGRLLREHARERNLMLNQLLHLAGRTWMPPPQPGETVEVTEETERYIYAPSQLLDDEE